MWLDGIYMLDVFYARWTHEFEPDNTTAWDDIALQFDLIDAGTQVERETAPTAYHCTGSMSRRRRSGRILSLAQHLTYGDGRLDGENSFP
jgi:hypothetical protein